MCCRSLYIHIPFCERKCPYCDFYSLPAQKDRMDAYLSALLRAISYTPGLQAQAAPFRLGELETIYFGGGTPSLFGADRLARVLEAVEKRFGVADQAEITVECNPHSTLPETLRTLKAAGVNRLWLGLQSADDGQLRALGRLHSVAGAEQAAEVAREAGFVHLSLDLMLATPGQTEEDVIKAAGLCRKLGAEHVSAYLLKIEPGTAFDAQNIGARCPDEDGQAALYRCAVKTLAAEGYVQYEISNFARAGRVARHNLRYWDCGEYLGLGASAHSFAGGRRFYFPRDADAFCQAENPMALCVDDGPGGGPEEYLMLRLRLCEGVSWSAFTERYPNYGLETLRLRARPLEKGGFLVCDAEGLRLTLDGFLVSNAVLAELL